MDTSKERKRKWDGTCRVIQRVWRRDRFRVENHFRPRIPFLSGTERISPRQAFLIASDCFDFAR